MERKPLIKIIIYCLVLLGLLLGALTVLFMPAKQSAERDIRYSVTEMIERFEERNAEAVADAFIFPLPVSWGNGEMSKSAFLDRLQSAFGQLSYVNIRVEEIAIEHETGNDEARATVSFHWTVSSHMYPNARSRSEDYNSDGAPETAVMILSEVDGDWKIAAIEEMTRR